MADLSKFLKDQLDKPSEDSKKWRMAIIGLKGVTGFFIVGAAIILFQPAAAPHAATMVQFALAAWGGIIAIFLGAQGSVDFKSTAVLQAAQVNETRHEVVEVATTETYDPAIEAKFANRYSSDPSYRPIATLPKEDGEVFR